MLKSCRTVFFPDRGDGTIRKKGLWALFFSVFFLGGCVTSGYEQNSYRSTYSAPAEYVQQTEYTHYRGERFEIGVSGFAYDRTGKPRIRATCNHYGFRHFMCSAVKQERELTFSQLSDRARERARTDWQRFRQ